MGKKKGKDKNKLARMSEDERLRYLQHRAELEEEAKRRKQQLISTFMKNKLKKEDAFTRLNVAKIKSEWRDILRKIKCRVLQEDLKAIKKECDESIQRKNSVIRRLLSDLDESEEIYSSMLHSHMNIVGKLIAISDERLEFFRRNYETEKRNILQSYGKDMADYKNKKFQLQKELESVYYGLAERTLKTTKTAEEEFLQRQDEIKNSMILKLETITKEREVHMEKLWKEFQNVLNSYLKYTEEYRDEYIDLRNRDAEDTRSIQDHYNEVSKLTERIAELKSQLINVKDEQDFNINQLIKHRNDLKLKMDKIKEDMENGLKDDKEKLKFLALTGSQSFKKLQTLLKRGKTIIQFIRLCENMERDHQNNIEAFPNTKRFLSQDEDELKIPPSPDDQGITNLYENLDMFWMRLNRTRIDCVCRQEEKASLKIANRELKVKLKHYLVTVNMTNGQPDQKNERFANRPASMKIERVEHLEISAKNQLIKKSKKERRPVTSFIEGNLSNAVRQLRIENLTRGAHCYAIKNELILIGNFAHGTPEDFLTSQWQRKEKSSWFVVYRWAIAAFFTFSVAFAVDKNIERGHFKAFFIYLTHLNLIGTMLTAFLGALLASLHDSDKLKVQPKTLPIAVKVYWFMWNQSVVLSCLVTMFYWGLLYRHEKTEIDANNVLVHMTNSIVLLVDLVIVRFPAKYSNFVHVIFVEVLYLLFTIVYQRAGGLNKKGKNFVYSSTDWINKLNEAVVNALAFFFLSIAVHFIVSFIHTLRHSAHRKLQGNRNVEFAVKEEVHIEEAYKLTVV